ncbi:hypothetical protein BHM03_00023934 [Ensete ventricosum]|nr:hypothetical protein BHM03_00023934 [Ensete ventricosum]
MFRSKSLSAYVAMCLLDLVEKQHYLFGTPTLVYVYQSFTPRIPHAPSYSVLRSPPSRPFTSHSLSLSVAGPDPEALFASPAPQTLWLSYLGLISLSPMAAYENDGGGIGGKFRKRPFRRAPATPYDRPQAVARLAHPLPSEPRGNGWFSRLVDPATRIISWSASRLFPSSIFQKRLRAPPAAPLGLVSRSFAHVLGCPVLGSFG